MGEEREAQNTAPESLDIDVDELNQTDLDYCRSLFFGRCFIGDDLLAGPEDEKEAILVAVQEFSNLVFDLKYDEILQFVEQNLYRSDLKIEFLSNALSYIPQAIESSIRYGKQEEINEEKYKYIFQECLQSVSGNENVFQNIRISREIEGKIKHFVAESGAGYWKSLVRELLDLNEKRLEDPKYRLRNYQNILPCNIADETIYNKVIFDINDPNRAFNKEELEDIVRVFYIYSRFYNKQGGQGLREPPFDNDDVFNAVKLINNKIESLPAKDREIVRFKNLLLAADIGQTEYFLQELFHNYEEMSEYLSELSMDFKELFLEKLNKEKGSADYIGKDIAMNMFDELILKKERYHSEELGHIYIMSFLEDGELSPYFFPRLMKDNYFAKEGILREVYKRNAYFFDITCDALVNYSSDEENRFSEILSKESVPQDFKYSLLMKLLLNAYKEGDMEKFNKYYFRAQYKYKEYEYEISSSPVTMFAYLTFLEGLCKSLQVKARTHRFSSSRKAMEEFGGINENLDLAVEEKERFRLLGENISKEKLLEFVSILKEYYEQNSKEMLLFEKAYFFKRMVGVLININLDSANETIKEFLNRELKGYMDYYDQFEYGPFTEGHDEENLSFLFSDLLFLTYFDEIKGSLLDKGVKDKDSELDPKEFRIPIIDFNPNDASQLSMEESFRLADLYSNYLIKHIPFKGAILSIDYVSGYFEDIFHNINGSLVKNLREIDAKYTFDRYLNWRAIQYLIRHEPDAEALRFVRPDFVERIRLSMEEDNV